MPLNSILKCISSSRKYKFAVKATSKEYAVGLITGGETPAVPTLTTNGLYSKFYSRCFCHSVCFLSSREMQRSENLYLDPKTQAKEKFHLKKKNYRAR